MKLSLFTLSSLPPLALSQEIYPNIPERDTCVAKCNMGDFCCVAQCHDLLCGNIHNTNDAIRCMTGCPAGVGTPEQVIALSRCREDCILNNYSSSSTSTWTSTSSTSTASSGSSSTYSATSTYSTNTSTSTSTGAASTTSSSSASAETSSSSTSTSTSTSTITITPTAPGSEPEETSNAASFNNLQLGAPATGFLGFIVAFLV